MYLRPRAAFPKSVPPRPRPVCASNKTDSATAPVVTCLEVPRFCVVVLDFASKVKAGQEGKEPKLLHSLLRLAATDSPETKG